MADRTRRRRNAPAEPATRRRRKGGNRSDSLGGSTRRRRRRATDDQDTGAPDAPEAADTPDTAAPPADQHDDSRPDADDGADDSDRSTTVATEVTLPQLGESVTEGTITAWLYSEGDTVEADEPLFELSSDKIDTEVPAPASGVLSEIKVQVDETVEVGTVVAIIGGEGDGDGGGDEEADEDADEGADEDAEADEAEQDTEAVEDEPADDESESEEQPKAEKAEKKAADQDKAEQPAGDGADVLASPLVRKLAADRGVDLGQVKGSGIGGRVTREDVEGATAGKPAAPAAAAPSRPAPEPSRTQVDFGSDRTATEDLSRIRRRIADKMMESLQTTAQLTTVQEADVTGIMRLRERVKDEFRAHEGVGLSPFVFMARAAVMALRNHPTLNARANFDEGSVQFHQYVNLGIAVDTEKGLIVPNVKGADDLTIAGLARAITAQAAKARGEQKLELSDIENGTFTVTNTGSRGVLLDTPILNIPESAILATGAVTKRPVVVTDAHGESIGIRDMVYLCLTYDHRLIDGADAARYVTEVAHILETHDWAAEVGYGS